VRTQLFLFAAAMLGGALNAVAGGGSFFTLPALIYAGVGAVSANATSTLAMWPASLASAVAYRREIAPVGQWLVYLGATSLIGGLVGGLLLVKTSDTHFLALLPWLLLAAVATFTFGGPLTRTLRRGRAPAIVPSDAAGSAPVARPPLWILILQLAIAIYGGYFGGGMGIMMLAALSVAGLTNIHEMNGLKTLLAVAINGVALVAFVADGAIAWQPGVVMVAGGIVGGYSGAQLARRGGTTAVRTFVIVAGWAMTVYFFVR
jgi:uncharacterized protein